MKISKDDFSKHQSKRYFDLFTAPLLTVIIASDFVYCSKCIELYIEMRYGQYALSLKSKALPENFFVKEGGLNLPFSILCMSMCSK